MVEYFEGTDMLEDDEGWCHLVDAVFVDPEDWLENTRIVFEDDDAMYIVCAGLSAAADEGGQLLYFRPDVWYEHHLSGVMRTEEDPQSWSLKFDRFTLTVVSGLMDRLFFTGWLAQSGNDGKRTVNWRLTIPCSSPAG